MRPSSSPLFVLALASLLPSQTATWIQPPTPTAPSFRRAGAMAFDGVANRLVLYGGTTPGPSAILNETWAYNGTWSQLSPATAAPGRWGHQMVRDTVRNRLVTFGGRSPTISGVASDTWLWNGTTWAELSTPSAPTARYLYGLAYDSRRDRVVLFGGRTATTTVGDTWEFDGVTWNPRATALAPEPREEMVMAFDVGRNTTVVFGGYDRDTDTMHGDTWEYDGADWREISPATSPTPRYRAGSAYDTQRQRLVVYGGTNGSVVFTQTYEYTGDDWRLVTVGAGTTLATEMYAAFDRQRNRFVTFGGVGTTFSNETWEFTGAATALFGTFGEGCPTTVGTATISAVTPPVLGTQFDMAVGTLPPGTGFVLVAQGFSSTTWNGQPLPFDLGILGMPGCALEVAADALNFVAVTGLTAQFGLLIPNTPSLANVALYSQVFVPDALVANGLGGLSRPARAIFGS